MWAKSPIFGGRSPPVFGGKRPGIPYRDLDYTHLSYNFVPNSRRVPVAQQTGMTGGILKFQRMQISISTGVLLVILDELHIYKVETRVSIRVIDDTPNPNIFNLITS